MDQRPSPKIFKESSLQLWGEVWKQRIIEYRGFTVDIKRFLLQIENFEYYSRTQVVQSDACPASMEHFKLDVRCKDYKPDDNV